MGLPSSRRAFAPSGYGWNSAPHRAETPTVLEVPPGRSRSEMRSPAANTVECAVSLQVVELVCPVPVVVLLKLHRTVVAVPPFMIANSIWSFAELVGLPEREMKRFFAVPARGITV